MVTVNRTALRIVYRKHNLSFLEARNFHNSFLIDNRVKQNISGPPKRVMGYVMLGQSEIFRASNTGLEPIFWS